MGTCCWRLPGPGRLLEAAPPSSPVFRPSFEQAGGFPPSGPQRPGGKEAPNRPREKQGHVRQPKIEQSGRRLAFKAIIHVSTCSRACVPTAVYMQPGSQGAGTAQGDPPGPCCRHSALLPRHPRSLEGNMAPRVCFRTLGSRTRYLLPCRASATPAG